MEDLFRKQNNIKSTNFFEDPKDFSIVTFLAFFS